MRRCPECQFIYEDDEGLCAMDGAALVRLSGPLPFEEAALPATLSPTHSFGRGLTLIAAGIMLAIAVFLWYHEVAKRRAFQSNQQRAARTFYVPPTNNQKPAAIPPVTATPLLAPSGDSPLTVSKTDATRKSFRAHESEESDPFRPVRVITATPLPKPSPSFTQTRPKIDTPPANSGSLKAKPTTTNSALRPPAVAEKHTKPSEPPEKQGSKITSFLKKTGRVLKKPFKH